ncbi:hypothetical protein [Streptomyces sp. NPDC002553]|uniref:hypothetical protein n=1 Tax=Streptomyces sp. NPDC002553 TaxID=3154417 RepID=UPI00331D6F13
MRIELHIGRIVLEGIPSTEAPAIRASLTSRLTELLIQGPPVTSHHTHRLTSRTMTAPSDPTAFGHTLAETVHTGLTCPARSGR